VDPKNIFPIEDLNRSQKSQTTATVTAVVAPNIMSNLPSSSKSPNPSALNSKKLSQTALSDIVGLALLDEGTQTSNRSPMNHVIATQTTLIQSPIIKGMQMATQTS
jgi:hypothetical protein